MGKIQTFDHCAVVVEDIPRAHQFYNKRLGAKPLWIANLNTLPQKDVGPGNLV